ncbi:MAG: hypothetical protein HYX29_01965 [Solirubrobacterales bacterium]|nr:hypothetical protein [Solirubrobacterales bacterium]
MNRSLAFIPVFTAGALLMFLFENTWTLLGGMIIQTVAVCMGVAAVAAPAFLEADADEHDETNRSAPTSDAGDSQSTR